MLKFSLSFSQAQDVFVEAQGFSMKYFMKKKKRKFIRNIFKIFNFFLVTVSFFREKLIEIKKKHSSIFLILKSGRSL